MSWDGSQQVGELPACVTRGDERGCPYRFCRIRPRSAGQVAGWQTTTWRQDPRGIPPENGKAQRSDERDLSKESTGDSAMLRLAILRDVDTAATWCKLRVDRINLSPFARRNRLPPGGKARASVPTVPLSPLANRYRNGEKIPLLERLAVPSGRFAAQMLFEETSRYRDYGRAVRATARPTALAYTAGPSEKHGNKLSYSKSSIV